MGGKMVEKMVVFAITGKRNKSCEHTREQIGRIPFIFSPTQRANNVHSLPVSDRLLSRSPIVSRAMPTLSAFPAPAAAQALTLFANIKRTINTLIPILELSPILKLVISFSIPLYFLLLNAALCNCDGSRTMLQMTLLDHANASKFS